VDLTDWLVALHVLSAFAWIAALVLYSLVIAAGRSLSVPSDVLRVFRIVRVGDALIAVGMIGTIVFGIWLAVDEYDLWDGWIIAAFVLWLIGVGTGERGGKAFAAGDSRRGISLQAVSSIAILLILVDMIWKPGA
jgi:uncharacterized membrane protein